MEFDGGKVAAKNLYPHLTIISSPGKTCPTVIDKSSLIEAIGSCSMIKNTYL